MNHTLKVLREIVAASEAYYKQLQGAPTFYHYQQFLNALSPAVKSHFLRKGYTASCRSSLLKRFVLEEAGVRMERFMRQLLSTEAYLLWRRQDSEATALLRHCLQTHATDTRRLLKNCAA